MHAFKSVLTCLILVVVAVGIVLVTGCGGNAEKDRMAGFIEEYQKNLDSYAEAIKSADANKKAELEAALEASKAQWQVLKTNASENMTPQAIEKLDRQFQTAVKQYATLNGKS